MTTFRLTASDTHVDAIAVCYSKDTRHGFTHICELRIYVDDIENKLLPDSFYMAAECRYLNRTWEKYTYQAVMIKAVKRLLDARTDSIKADYRRAHNLRAITSEHDREAVNALILADKIIDFCASILTELRAAQPESY